MSEQIEATYTTVSAVKNLEGKAGAGGLALQQALFWARSSFDPPRQDRRHPVRCHQGQKLANLFKRLDGLNQESSLIVEGTVHKDSGSPGRVRIPG